MEKPNISDRALAQLINLALKQNPGEMQRIFSLLADESHLLDKNLSQQKSNSNEISS